MSIKYKAIITGDVINSRMVSPDKWMKTLKSILSSQGNEPESWEIYRGDSFQLIVDPQNALNVALMIKAAMKQFKKLDVRMAIGIGEIDYIAGKITESNGTAFILSGECFAELKKNTLGLLSPWNEFNRTVNVMIDLAMLTIDNWTPASSQIILLKLQNPSMKQIEMAKKLKKPQSNISAGLKRGGFDEIDRFLQYYCMEIDKLC